MKEKLFAGAKIAVRMHDIQEPCGFQVSLVKEKLFAGAKIAVLMPLQTEITGMGSTGLRVADLRSGH